MHAHIAPRIFVYVFFIPARCLYFSILDLVTDTSARITGWHSLIEIINMLGDRPIKRGSAVDGIAAVAKRIKSVDLSGRADSANGDADGAAGKEVVDLTED